MTRPPPKNRREQIEQELEDMVDAYIAEHGIDHAAVSLLGEDLALRGNVHRSRDEHRAKYPQVPEVVAVTQPASVDDKRRAARFVVWHSPEGLALRHEHLRISARYSNSDEAQDGVNSTPPITKVWDGFGELRLLHMTAFAATNGKHPEYQDRLLNIRGLELTAKVALVFELWAKFKRSKQREQPLQLQAIHGMALEIAAAHAKAAKPLPFEILEIIRTGLALPDDFLWRPDAVYRSNDDGRRKKDDVKEKAIEIEACHIADHWKDPNRFRRRLGKDRLADLMNVHIATVEAWRRDLFYEHQVRLKAWMKGAEELP